MIGGGNTDSDGRPPWTRLTGTKIFAAAREKMNGSRCRYYHRFDHVFRLYHHAGATLNLSYDRALDLAILAHDVVFDRNPDRELRSIAWLRNHLPDGEKDPDFKKASRLIETTIDHRLTEDPRLVLLDLADFIDAEATDQNSALLRLEARDLHGVNGVCFAVSFERYLGDLLARFRDGGENLPAPLRVIHEDICKGICRSRSVLALEARNFERKDIYA